MSTACASGIKMGMSRNNSVVLTGSCMNLFTLGILYEPVHEMWYVRPAKPQISLRIRAVSSEPLQVA